MKRRAFLAGALLLTARGAAAADVEFPPVVPGVALAFPRDHGAHPAFRTEWWYITGWLRDDAGNDYGLQITFFRNRPGVAEDNPSAFAPRQLLFAHAALADPRRGQLAHDQRAARAGFGIAGAAEETTRVWIGDWSLELADNIYTARIVAREFAFELRFSAARAVLLEGEGGYSRKGRVPSQASYYYSRPQLAVSGQVANGGKPIAVTGTAWLDHEWSSEGMASGAIGWDWVGINLADGGAVMAFRMRDRAGGAVWAGGAHRAADGSQRSFAPDEVRFTPQRRWRSPRTQVEYPVAMHVDAGGVAYTLVPLIDDQELDSRASTSTVYWEGAVRVEIAGRDAGRGYLELTGYWKPLQLH
jgi:predicted secreted hydrolase